MSLPRPIRVLVVDDSAVTRRWLRAGLETHEEIEVVGAAEDAFAAYDSIFELHPDVLTLDVEMPRMDGLTFLRKLMRHHPLPVVIHSSVTPRSSGDALSALSLGAVDVVPKGAPGTPPESTLKRLATSVRAAARARPRALDETHARPPRQRPADEAPLVNVPERLVTPASRVRAIGITASTGGPRAVETILRRIPGDFPCVLIVQHLPAYFTKPFVARLNSASPARVRVARDGAPLRAGEVLIAPGNHHLSMTGDGRARITEGPKVNFHRPSGDVLFRSMARNVGSAGVGLILTGMGRDGAAGLRKMFDAGAHTIAESESSCAVYGMPRAAVEAGGVSEVVDLDEVTHRLSRAVQEPGIHAC